VEASQRRRFGSPMVPLGGFLIELLQGPELWLQETIGADALVGSPAFLCGMPQAIVGQGQLTVGTTQQNG
jgi:hypothetical protein